MAAVLKSVASEAPQVDLDYIRRRYDEALVYAQFVAKRIGETQREMEGKWPALYWAIAARLNGQINDFTYANYVLFRSYLALCEANEWDDDDAKAAGVEVREVRL